MVELLRPHETGVRLPHDRTLVLRRALREDLGEKAVGLVDPPLKHRGESRAERGVLRDGFGFGGKTQLEDDLFAAGNRHGVMRRGLRSLPCRVHGVPPALDHIFVERVLHVRRGRRRSEKRPVFVSLSVKRTSEAGSKSSR